MRFAPAPEYQVFPHGPEPLDFYEAVVHAARDTLPLVRELRPDVVVADILTLAPALAAELEGVPLGDADPARLPARAPRASRSTRSARGCRGRALGRGVCGGARSPVVGAGSSAGARELNETRARLGLPPLDHVHGGISRAARARRHVPAARVPAALARARAHVVGPLMWEPPAERRRAAAGGERRRSCSSRRRRRRTPSTGCCAPRSRAWPTRRCACSRPGTGGCPPRPLPVPDERAASSTGSPTRARCRAATSSSATPATARSCARSRAAAPSSPARPSAT